MKRTTSDLNGYCTKLIQTAGRTLRNKARAHLVLTPACFQRRRGQTPDVLDEQKRAQRGGRAGKPKGHIFQWLTPNAAIRSSANVDDL